MPKKTDKSKKKPLSDAQIKQRVEAGKKRKGKKNKNGYAMTEKALNQRKAASQLSTGPRTEEGKAISSRDNYRHGMYSRGRAVIESDWSVGAFGKPCQTTCQYHPDNKKITPAYPCTLVLEGVTKAGGDCMDKTIYVTAFDRLLQSLESGSVESMNEILAAEAAGALEILHSLRKEISEHGFVVRVPAINKDGEPIMDKAGNVIITKVLRNPILPDYYKMLDTLGINLPELLATPLANSKIGEVEDGANTLAHLLGAALGNVSNGQRRGVTIEHEK